MDVLGKKPIKSWEISLESDPISCSFSSKEEKGIHLIPYGPFDNAIFRAKEVECMHEKAVLVL